MKKIVIILLFVSSALVFAQTKHYNFTYDASGNRLTRTISYSRIAAPDSLAAKSITDTEHDVKLFPNPTSGLLTMTISNLKSDSKGRIDICDLNGLLIYSQNDVFSQNTIDLSKATNGFFILKMEIDGKYSTWKIIKNN